MTALCIAGIGKAVHLAALAFTLAWTHTVQKTSWEEDWRIEPGRLVLVEARIEGSGAGMEPPPDAVLAGGRYVWHPTDVALPELVLRRAPEAGDWRICVAGACGDLGEIVGAAADPVRISPCS
jgi:hypothetical protein